MAIDRVYTKVLDEPNTPARLKGKTLTATVEVGKAIEFSCEIPDDATANEKGYLEWYIGELTDKLKAAAPGVFGENKTIEIIPSPK
jgi:hypothetical protein